MVREGSGGVIRVTEAMADRRQGLGSEGVGFIRLKDRVWGSSG